jgi:cyclopropane-fatty-acyl-phospholipid synthase
MNQDSPPTESSLALRLAERGWLPDGLLRTGIRRILRRRLRDLETSDSEALLDELRTGPIAALPEKANEQHYELPAAFFQTVLGSQLKYSCGWFGAPGTSLDDAEEQMLELTCERARLADGMRVLDLGCGWGSLSLWIARAFPACRVLAVSNSKLQREHILARCAEQGIENVEVVTADMNVLEAPDLYDRILSIEMFEHMRNWPALLRRIASWLTPEGQAFLHVFCHRSRPYLFETTSRDDWMGRHFFSGGMMPSDQLIYRFDDALRVAEHWRVSGRHYQRTSDAWLEQLDRQRASVLDILESVYGPEGAALWLERWRIFFLAVSELFGYRDGNEWWVSHYRLEKAQGQA